MGPAVRLLAVAFYAGRAVAQPPAGQPSGGPGCIGNMANLEAWSSVPSAGTHPDGSDIEGLFRVRYVEMVRLAGLCACACGLLLDPAPPARAREVLPVAAPGAVVR